MARQRFNKASFPTPGERYDPRNEAHFRAAVAQAVESMLNPIPEYSDATRPTAGPQDPLIIFNTDDGNLNIDNGTAWILPDGTTT